MKALIIYILTWFLVLAAAGVMYFTGSFNEMVLTVFGFVLSTLFFAGFLAVLPFWVDEHYLWKY